MTTQMAYPHSSDCGMAGSLSPPNLTLTALCSTDELFKSSAYLTEAYTHHRSINAYNDTTQTPFNSAFDTRLGYFGWLEQGGHEMRGKGKETS